MPPGHRHLLFFTALPPADGGAGCYLALQLRTLPMSDAGINPDAGGP